MPDLVTAAIITASATLLVGIISAVVAWRKSHTASHPAFSPPHPEATTKTEPLKPIETPISSSSHTPERAPEDPMSPQHMIKTVSAAPPLAREHVKQQFIGLPVEWHLSFSDAFRQGTTSTATVYFLLPSSNHEVRCEVSLEKFPFLRVATASDSFHIRGVVENVSSIEVVLRDVVLSK